MGQAIEEACPHEDAAVILGTRLNTKQSPLCGRNFAYFSEDPLLMGELASALVRGIQSKGAGTCIKHFAANNQEKARLASNSVVDEWALHEIYLSGFESVVKEQSPGR